MLLLIVVNGIIPGVSIPGIISEVGNRDVGEAVAQENGFFGKEDSMVI